VEEKIKNDITSLISKNKLGAALVVLSNYANSSNNDELKIKKTLLEKEYAKIESDYIEGLFISDIKLIKEASLSKRLLLLVEVYSVRLEGDGVEAKNEKVIEVKSVEPSHNMVAEKLLIIIYDYGSVAIFLLSIYILFHFSFKMMTSEEYINALNTNSSYIPFVVALTGIASAGFMRTITSNTKTKIDS